MVVCLCLFVCGTFILLLCLFVAFHNECTCVRVGLLARVSWLNLVYTADDVLYTT